MNHLVRKFSFVALMIIVSISLSGCKLDISKIGDFVAKIGQVVSKVGSFLQNLGAKIKENANKDTSTTAAAPTSSSPTASDTTTAATPATTAAPTTQNPVITVPGSATTTAVPTIDDEAKLVADAVTRYNKDHSEMITKIDKETLERLVSNGYLKQMPVNADNLSSSGDLTAEGKIIKVETKPAGAPTPVTTTPVTTTATPQDATKETGTPATSNNPSENPYGTTGTSDPNADIAPDAIKTPK